MRWPNGGPPKLYVVVHNPTGHVQMFTRLRERQSDVKSCPYEPGEITLLTYVQEAAR